MVKFFSLFLFLFFFLKKKARSTVGIINVEDISESLLENGYDQLRSLHVGNGDIYAVAQAIHIIAVESFRTYKCKYAMACWAKDSYKPCIKLKGQNFGNSS